MKRVRYDGSVVERRWGQHDHVRGDQATQKAADGHGAQSLQAGLENHGEFVVASSVGKEWECLTESMVAIEQRGKGQLYRRGDEVSARPSLSPTMALTMQIVLCAAGSVNGTYAQADRSPGDDGREEQRIAPGELQVNDSSL